MWSPDGRSLAYARHRALREEADTYVMEVSSPGEGRALLSADGDSEHATSWSSQAGAILFEQEGNVRRQDLWLLPLVAGARPRPWLATPANEHRAVISPDGQWVAYQSDRIGRPEIYVRPLASPETGEVAISTRGGRAPRWQRAGRELYFVSEDWQVMAASPGADAGWAGVTARVLFEIPGRLPSPAVPPAFDVTADGSRFLVAAPPNPNGDPPVTVVVNWLVVTVWLKSEQRNPTYALVPMLFMYVTTLFATVITARNLYVTIAANPKMSGLPVAGAWAMIVVSALLLVAALIIGWDGLKAYRRYAGKPAAPAPSAGS